MTTPNSSGSGRVPSDQTDVQQPSIEKIPEHALASRFPNVKVNNVAPKRNHVTSDLLHAGAALVFGILVILVAVYLHGLTTGVEDDAHSASQAFDWLVDLPSSLLQQLIVISIVVGVLIQLVLNREWLQSACSVGALLIGFLVCWGVSELLSYHSSAMLINTLLSSGTRVGPSLLPDFYAAIASFLTVAGPRDTRSSVKWSWNILLAGAVIFIMTSWSSLPGVLVAICIGRMVGLFIRFGVGTKNSGAWGYQIVQALSSIGLHPAVLDRRPEASDHAPMLADDLTDHSRLYDLTDESGVHYVVSVLDNQMQITGYFSQLWQLIRLSGVAVRHDRSAVSATHHHYSMLLGLRDIDLTCARPYGVCDYGESSIVVFEHRETIHAVDCEELDDTEVLSLMNYLQHAHQRGFTHRQITADTIARSANGDMVIAGWQNGDYASATTNITLDKVQLLTLFSTMLGIERTVSLARRAWGESTLISLIPFVQKAAVPAATRQMEGWNKQIVEDLRTALSKLAPEEVAESMEQVTLTRFNARSFFGLVLLVIAVYVMLTQMRPDEMIRAVKQANLWWAFVVMLFGFLAWVGSAMALGAFMDRDRRRPFGLLCSQIAAGFTAVSMPAGIGPAFVNLQYLRKSGYRNTTATAIMSAVLAVQGVITVVLLLLIGIFTGRNTLSGMIPTNTLILTIAVVALVISVIMAIPSVRRKIADKYLPLVKSYARSLLETLTQPRKLLGSVAGSLILNLSTGFGFWAALMAFGFNMNPIETTFIFLLANTLGSAVPTPGGLGAVEAALSVAFSAVGVPAALALSATLLYRVVFYWLRIPLGALAMKWLDKHNLI